MTDKSTGKALLVVDVQRDFCSGGALAVPNGDLVVQPLNRGIKFFDQNRDSVFFSEDCHPHTTKHFKEFGGIWPVHCVRTTWGAEFHPNLYFPLEHIYETVHEILKGEGSEDDGYSAFEGHIYVPSPLGTRKWTLSEMLEGDFLEVFGGKKVKELYVGGLATDWCVKATCLDAIKLGYNVYLLTDACRAVNINDPNDPRRSEPEIVEIINWLSNHNQPITDENIAIEEMRRAGVIFTTTDKVIHESR